MECRSLDTLVDKLWGFRRTHSKYVRPSHRMTLPNFELHEVSSSLADLPPRRLLDLALLSLLGGQAYCHVSKAKLLGGATALLQYRRVDAVDEMR
jgi:hypothetical protein